MMVNSLEHYGVFDELEKQNTAIKNSQPQIIIIKGEERKGMSDLKAKSKKE